MMNNIWGWIMLGGAVALSGLVIEWVTGIVGFDSASMGVIGTVIGLALLGATLKYVQSSRQYAQIGGA